MEILLKLVTVLLIVDDIFIKRSEISSVKSKSMKVMYRKTLEYL